MLNTVVQLEDTITHKTVKKTNNCIVYFFSIVVLFITLFKLI